MSEQRVPLQVGDTIPTMVFDEDNKIVGAVLALVIRVGNDEVEIVYPDGVSETIRDSESPSASRQRCGSMTSTPPLP